MIDLVRLGLCCCSDMAISSDSSKRSRAGLPNNDTVNRAAVKRVSISQPRGPRLRLNRLLCCAIRRPQLPANRMVYSVAVLE
jgi:hypothetical protein